MPFVLKNLFKPRPQVLAGKALYAAAVARAREPAFYARLGVPDTNMGRFELYTLHVILLVRRLKGEPAAKETAQALFDAYVEGLDIALREIGVGDLSVGKKMKKFGRAFYGRAQNYDEAMAQEGDAALQDLIGRTIYEGVTQPDTQPLASYVRAADATLADLPDEALLAGKAAWPKDIA